MLKFFAALPSILQRFFILIQQNYIQIYNLAKFLDTLKSFFTCIYKLL